MSDGDRPRRLMVYLHGHGSSPAEVPEYFRAPAADGWTRVCPRAPHAVAGGWSWFESGPRGVLVESLDQGIAVVVTAVGAILDETGADWSDVVLGGFSQGAALSVAAAAQLGAGDAGPLAGLLAQAGFVPEAVDREVDVSAIRAATVLVQHGVHDEIVPAFMGTDLAAALGAASGVGEVEFQSIDGGHTVSEPMLAGVRRWLAAR